MAKSRGVTTIEQTEAAWPDHGGAETMPHGSYMALAYHGLPEDALDSLRDMLKLEQTTETDTVSLARNYQQAIAAQVHEIRYASRVRIQLERVELGLKRREGEITAGIIGGNEQTRKSQALEQMILDPQWLADREMVDAIRGQVADADARLTEAKEYCRLFRVLLNLRAGAFAGDLDGI